MGIIMFKIAPIIIVDDTPIKMFECMLVLVPTHT